MELQERINGEPLLSSDDDGARSCLLISFDLINIAYTLALIYGFQMLC